MPFDSFNSFDSFASIFALAENARMLAEMKRAQREIQQQNAMKGSCFLPNGALVST